MHIFKNKMLITAIVPILLIVSLSVVSFASTFSASTSTRQALAGVVYNVTGEYTVSSNGFFFAATPYVANAAWSDEEILTAGIAVNHWYYSITLTAQTGVTPGTISVEWSQNGADYAPLGSVVTITGTPASGESVTVLFDTDVATGTSINAPVAIVITVTEAP